MSDTPEETEAEQTDEEKGWINPSESSQQAQQESEQAAEDDE